MILLFILCFALGIWGVRPRPADKDPLAPAVTSSINGIFVLLVMLTHFYQYAGKFLSGPLNSSYAFSRHWMGQTVVATFLFFSGYGLMEQIRKKGRPYARGLFKNRFLKVLLHFDLAILLFFAMGLYMGKTETPLSFLSALIGWSKLAVGNSNWFMFATFCLYLIVFIAFYRYDAQKPTRSLWCMTALVLVYILLIAFSPNNSSRFYNTVFCFVVGMWFSQYKEKFYAFWQKSNRNYYLSLLTCLVVGTVFALLCTGKERFDRNLLYNFYSLSVAFFFVLLCQKCVFGNPLMRWLGKYTFPIYILQRIPYVLFRHLGLLAYNRAVYFAVCVLSTLVLAVLFQYLTDYLDKRVFKK